MRINEFYTSFNIYVEWTSKGNLIILQSRSEEMSQAAYFD